MLPFSTIGEKFDDILRFSAVYLIILAFFIADVIALPSPLDGLSLIPFMMITTYYWAIYRPTVLPVFVVFALGILLDIMSGMPLGFNAIILVLIHWAISDQRAFLTAQSFIVIWLAFSVIYTTIVILQWLIFGLLNFDWASLSLITPQLIAGIVSFPFVMIILHLAHKILPRANFPLTSR